MASIDITGGDKAATAARRAAQQAVTVEDPMVQSVKPVFLMFLQQYRLPSSGSSTALPAADELPLYVQAAHQLEMAQSTTLYVDYTHVAHYQPQLCNTIREHFYRLAPHLNAVVQQFMLEFAPQHDKHIQGLQSIAETSPFRVAFYHLPVISTIRDLKTGKIGELMSISGTVTRTSAVRPELRLATFRCGDCKTINANIAQQFRYSEVRCTHNIHDDDFAAVRALIHRLLHHCNAHNTRNTRTAFQKRLRFDSSHEISTRR
jgi:DNA replication licensing factor MCM6